MNFRIAIHKDPDSDDGVHRARSARRASLPACSGAEETLRWPVEAIELSPRVGCSTAARSCPTPTLDVDAAFGRILRSTTPIWALVTRRSLTGALKRWP